jgi:membrane associated rhomboid family serine protease
MERPCRHLSRPLYEGLPWIYMASGVLALAGSYWLAAHGALSLIVGLFGLVALVGGFVVLLRRRDYRELRSQYADPDALTREDKP